MLSQSSEGTSSISPLTLPSRHDNELYYSALQLKQAIDHGPSFSSNWPPSSAELSFSNGEDCVPISLYNTLAIAIGATNDIPLATERVTVSDSRMHHRLISICQDIIYARFKGKTPTPKALALGLTLKHMTGSSHIVKLVSGLGHCCSYESVQRIETAMAIKQVQNEQQIPDGFGKCKLTVMVYDNIDFSEETLSGAGSTHHMNGIIFQDCKDSSTTFPAPEIETPTSTRSRAKSLATTPVVLEPYHVGPRKGAIVPDARLLNIYECSEFIEQVIDQMLFVLLFY